MIQRIIEWIRKVWMTMIGKQSIKQAMQIDVAISEPMVKALELWTAMYENRAEWLNDNVKSLNLPAAIASEIARMATIEMQVKVDGSKRADYLAIQFEKVLYKLRDAIEFGSAKGGIVFKPYIDGKNLNVDFVHADQFYPVEFDSNGNITSAIFIDQRKRRDIYYTRLEYHESSDTGYVVRNSAYKSNTKDMLGVKVSLSTIDDWDGLAEEAIITGIEKPLFAYFRYPLANSIDPASPLGVSCYSRAVDLIKNADKQWSDLMWEFESGQRALYVDVLAFGKDKNGKPVLPNRRLYRTLETGSAEGEFYKEWSPTLREQNILNGLDRILKQIEFACGLAYGTISDPNTIEKTATEIASAKQRSYSTVVDVQKAIRNTLNDLLYAMDVWATLGTLAPKGKYTATYDFDDSVIVDSDAQFQRDLRLVQQGIMSAVEFRVRNFKEDEETAKRKVAEARADTETIFKEEI